MRKGRLPCVNMSKRRQAPRVIATVPSCRTAPSCIERISTPNAPPLSAILSASRASDQACVSLAARLVYLDTFDAQNATPEPRTALFFQATDYYVDVNWTRESARSAFSKLKMLLLAQNYFARKNSCNAAASFAGCSNAKECPHSSYISDLSTDSASLRIPSFTVGPKNSGAPMVMIGSVSLPPFSSKSRWKARRS